MSIRPLHPPALKDQTVLVLGAGESGLAIAKWLHHWQAHVYVVDNRSEPPQAEAIQSLGVKVHFGHFDETTLNLSRQSFVVVSPGLPLSSPAIIAAQKQGLLIVGEIELFIQGLKYLKPSAQLLGITGSNGKTTTMRLLEIMLKQAHRKVTIAGNISPSALHQLLLELENHHISDLWLLELSSFQLATLHSGMFTAATILNIQHNHQDWHGSFNDYYQAKKRLLKNAHLKIVNHDNTHTRQMVENEAHVNFFSLKPPNKNTVGHHWYYCTPNQHLYVDDCLIASRTKSPLIGSHNTENILAALALAHAVDVDPSISAKTLPHFTGLAHRCEWLTNINGIDYVNDAKSTTISSTQAALNALNKKAVLILGGQSKQQDFSLLQPTLHKYARSVILIGEDAPKIEKALQKNHLYHFSNVYSIHHANSLSKALQTANQQAQSGDCIILSPACASLDMFSNYEHRGTQFRNLVTHYEQTI